MTGYAVLVIDMLNDFLDRWSAADRAGLVANINRLVAVGRNADIPVIWVRQEFEPDLSDAFAEMRRLGISSVIKGTKGAQIDSTLHRDPDDLVIVKKRYSAFFGTTLDEHLAEAGIDTLIIAGINTHACIRMAAIDAYQRDMDVIIARDCIDTYDAKHGAITLDYLDGKIATLKSNDELAALLA